MLNLLILKITKFTKIFSVPVLYVFLFRIFSPVLFAGDIDEPTLGQARPLLINIMNWLVFLIGVVFVVVVAYGAWKASTATGDPRGLDSAKSTWSYAIFGLLVVAGFFALHPTKTTSTKRLKIIAIIFFPKGKFEKTFFIIFYQINCPKTMFGSF